MLQAMRQNTKVVLWITIIFFILLIVLVWGADLRLGGGGPQPGTIGMVNGEPIPYAAYQNELSVSRRVADNQGRDLQPTDLLLLEEDSWNTVIDRMLLAQEASRRGLDAEKSEILKIMLNSPPPSSYQIAACYNEQGQFDINRYRAFITSPATPDQTLRVLESEVRTLLPLQKLAQVMQSGAKVTENEVREAFRDQSEKARISYVIIDLDRQGVDDSVDDAAIAAWYESHRGDYNLPRRADLNYISIPRRATAMDSVQIVRDLMEYKNEAELAASEAGNPDSESLALDFASLAATFSDAPTADQGGLSAGYLTDAEMTPAFRRALEGVSVGGITRPFQDGAFYRILQLVDEKVEEEQRQVQIRDLAIRIAPSDSTLAEVRDQLDVLRRDAEATSLTEAAEKAGLPLQTAANITTTGIVPGLSAIPRVASFALGNPEGAVSRVYETNAGWFLLEVKEIRESGVPALEEIKPRVRGDILENRRFENSRALADRVSGSVKLGQTLEDAAAEYEHSVVASPEFTRRIGVPGLGRDAEVIAAAFSGEPGSVSDPIRASRGWVLVRVDEHIMPTDEEYAAQADQIRNTLLSVKQSQIYNALMESLRDRAKIVDYRS